MSISADYGNKRIQEFTSSGAFLAKWGSAGNGDGQFQGPVDLAVDPATSKIYVTDEHWIA